MAKKIQQKQVEGLSDDLQNRWNTKGNADTDPEKDFIGTTDAHELVLRTNDIVRVRYLPDGTIFYGEGQTTDGTIIVGYHNTDKANPLFRYSSVIEDATETTPATQANLQIGIARRKGFPHKLANVGDVSILRGGKGKKVIFGTRTNVEKEDEKVSIVIAPGQSADYTPFIVEAQVGNKGFVGINTPSPKDLLDINSGIAGDSGVTIRGLTDSTAPTVGAKTLGIKSGKMVIAPVPEVTQIQADYKETNPSSLSYIQNKPKLLDQVVYGINDFDWNFHPDLNINGFSVFKTGKQVMITAFFSITSTSETEFITLFKIPEELKPDPSVQFVDGFVNIFRFATISRKYLRSFELLTHTSEIILDNSPFTGMYDELTDLNNTEFKISLSYSME